MPGRDWYYDMSSNQRLLQTRTADNTPQVVLGYDGRGNVTSRRDLRSAQGFTYDLADRVLTTTRNGVLQATHVYDGNGLRTRTSKPAPGAPQPDRDLRFQIYTPGGVFQWENDIECSQLRSRGVNYVRLAGSLLAKVVANSTLTQAECYPGTSNSEQQVLSLNPFRNPFTGATEVVAGNDGGRDGEAPSAPTSTTTYSIVYVHTDALGSPIAETNINATVIPGSRTQYEPYGKPLTTPREGAPSYTGHQHDTSTGLIYAQQRYYDPALGRFLSTDPMAVDMGAAGNWNRYAYAANNPYRFRDPDGRESVGEMIDSSAMAAFSAGNNGAAYGWAFAATAWNYFGAEGVSQVADKGMGAGFDNAAMAALELATLGKGRAVGEAVGAGLGVVYRRVNPLTLESYIRKAKSFARYLARQGEHNRALGVKHEFEILGRAAPDKRLSLLEEKKIRSAGGPRSEGCPLANKIHAMSAEKFDAFQGTFRVDGRIDSARLDKELSGK